MATQTATVAQLQRRAEEINILKDRNRKREEEMWERERERDRGELRARMKVSERVDDVNRDTDRDRDVRRGRSEGLSVAHVDMGGLSENGEIEGEDEQEGEREESIRRGIAVSTLGDENTKRGRHEEQAWVLQSRRDGENFNDDDSGPVIRPPTKMVVRRKKKVRQADIED